MKKPKITPGEWTFSKQNGIPGHCMMAQVWGGDEDGTYVATMRATNNPKEASANAKAISAVPEMIDALIKLHSYVKENQPNYLLSSKYISLHEIEQALKKAGVEL